MTRNFKYFAVIGALVIIFLILAFLVFLAKNTDLLNYPSATNIAENNTSEETGENSQAGDFSALEAQELKVPDQFKNGIFATPKTMNLPKGFEIALWATNIAGARAIDFTAQNNIVVSAKAAGAIYLIKNNVNSEVAGETIKIDSGLNNVHGIDYYNGDLYVGEENQVTLYSELKEDGTYAAKKIIISDLPSGGHATRTVKVGPDQKLYVAIGSSCNLCEESDPRRAAIMRYNLDGTGGELFASGLRNTVDFVSHETDSTLQFWGVDNGRDLLGDDLPPEEVNIIHEGQNYGWPYCYGNQINNPEYSDRKDYCLAETQAPMFNMQAHSAPLGLTFVPEESTAQQMNFPDAFKDELFVTFHGSWNRSIPTGYKVVRINTASTQSESVNFITGWLDASGNVWGRPVGIRFDISGSMFIADDEAGVIYKVSYVGS